MRRVLLFVGLTAASVVVLSGAALAVSQSRDGRIVGHVLVCNAPGHCLTRRFHVSAVDSAGRTVAKTVTRSSNNAFALRIPAGSYELLANASGLQCHASAVAIAHETTHQDITCLVP